MNSKTLGVWEGKLVEARNLIDNAELYHDPYDFMAARLKLKEVLDGMAEEQLAISQQEIMPDVEQIFEEPQLQDIE